MYVCIQGTHGVTVLLEMDTLTQVQILNEAVCISRSANTLEKGISLTILSPAMGKQ